MPTFADLTGLVTAFIVDYDILVYAGAALGLLIYTVRKFVKAGR